MNFDSDPPCVWGLGTGLLDGEVGVGKFGLEKQGKVFHAIYM